MHGDPIGQVGKLAEAAMAAMTRRQIAPYPDHYLLW